MIQKSNSQHPKIWVLTSGEVGMVNQAVGLAQSSGFDFEVKKIILKKFYRFLTGDIAAKLGGLHVLHEKSDPLTPPFPDIIIACGRRSIAAALAVKAHALKQNSAKIFLVYIHNPRIAFHHFDMVIPSYHDTVFGDNVYPTGPSLHRVTAQTLKDATQKFTFPDLSRPLLSVFIGGNRRSHRMEESVADAAGKQLKQLSKKYGIALSFSRRTPAGASKAFLHHLQHQKNVYIWDETSENPYFGMLAQADAILVSAESVSMISEAIFTGKPVYLLQLPGKSRRFDRFHQWLYDNDYCRPFRGKIETNWGKSIDDTTRIAAILREQYRKFSET